MGRIFIRAMRPVPVWLIFLGSGGTAEPVRMNCPNSSLWSTSNRTASHSCGASCHSSMRRGVAPLSNSRGAISARRMFCALVLGSCRYIALSASLSHVVVLPHHLAPSTRTAPFALTRFLSNGSYILGDTHAFLTPIHSLSKDNLNRYFISFGKFTLLLLVNSCY